jgi:hypothetical protein
MVSPSLGLSSWLDSRLSLPRKQLGRLRISVTLVASPNDIQHMFHVLLWISVALCCVELLQHWPRYKHRNALARIAIQLCSHQSCRAGCAFVRRPYETLSATCDVLSPMCHRRCRRPCREVPSHTASIVHGLGKAVHLPARTVACHG